MIDANSVHPMPEPRRRRAARRHQDFLSRFVVYPGEPERIAHVLWIAHTLVHGCWESTPRIAFLSPEPGSGKSRALEVTEPLVPRPVHAVNTTPAYLFRKVSDPDGLPTILYDEIDTVFGPKAKEQRRDPRHAQRRAPQRRDRRPVRGSRQDRRNRGTARLLRRRTGRPRRSTRHHHDAQRRRPDAPPRRR